MVTLIKYGALSGGEKYNVNQMYIDGLSRDSKPTTTIDGMGIPNGSVYTEIDTGKTYMFDAANATWYEVSLGGGGGGGIKLVGETTTALTDGATTNPITIDGQSYTAQPNDAVIYGNKEFLFDGTHWHEFGDMTGLGTAAFEDVPQSGDASSTEVVMGNDSRLARMERILMDSTESQDYYLQDSTPSNPSDGDYWFDGSDLVASDITAMTGYAKASAASAIVATDTLNQAMGKLEKKADDNTSSLSSKQNQVLGSWTAGTATTHSTPASTDTVLEALQKIDNNQRLDETNILSIQQEQITQNNEIATLREITNCKLYGYRIDKQNTNPDTRVTYLYDAVGMTPAYMDFSGGSFNYGSWADIWFIAKNRPVALKYDGTVDYELSHTDFTKKIDGETASDVSDSTYGGNFMSEIPLVYVKRWEDTRYNYVVFCETKPNDDYLAQAHTNANGTVNPYIYLPMFKGSIDANNKLRSLMGTIPNGNTTAANEVTYVENCGSGWQLWDKAKIDLIMDLIVLITKSTNCRGKIGNGDCQTYNASDTRKDSKNNGANGKMMSGYEVGDTTRSTNAQFYGSEGTDVTNYGKHHMIAFYIEDLWANRWDRCLGFNLVDNVYKVKMTPPYALDSDSTYQTLSVAPPSSTEGWLKNVSSGVYGDVPTEVGASNVSGFANYFYKNASGARLSLFGGNASNGLKVGRCWGLNSGATFSHWTFGGSPCYNAL